MSNNIEVSDVVLKAGMLKGRVTVSYDVDVVAGYSGKGDRETLEMILKSAALSQIHQEVTLGNNSI